MQARQREIARFAVVGVLATLTHFVILYALVEHVGLSPSLANGTAFLCAVCVTWMGQSRWVFAGHGHTSMAKLLRFAVSLTVGLLANVAIMLFVTEGMTLDYRIGFAIVSLVVPVLSFAINKLWVFRRAIG